MKLAKASQQEIDTLMRWLQAREGTGDPPPPYMRVVFGYEMMINNCADPEADVLEFKPEIKAALEDAKRLDVLAANSYREGGKGGYAPVYVIASSSAWPVADHELSAAEKRKALRAAIDSMR